MVVVVVVVAVVVVVVVVVVVAGKAESEALGPWTICTTMLLVGLVWMEGYQ